MIKHYLLLKELSALSCAECGFALGVGNEGALSYCSHCAKYVLTKANESDSAGVIGSLFVLAAGAVLAWWLFGRK